MTQKVCPVEPLIISKYCQLSVCMECEVVNLNLPGRVSFQFEAKQFIDIAHAFYQASQILREKQAPKQQTGKMAKVTYLH